jgi:pimeloyl-ACP methyl ester carboxylesterase
VGQQSILVIMQGSDCNSIALHPSIGEYAEVAPNHAVLFVEKYGITNDLSFAADDSRMDCPAAYLEYNTLAQRVLDHVQVIAELRRSASWWNGKLTILAGSAGTFAGEQVAALVPETERLVIFGFGSRRLETDVLSSIRASFDADGMPEAAREQELAEIAELFQEMLENPTPKKKASGHSYIWWASMFRFDELVALQQVPVPVLAIQGSRDQNVSPEGARALINELRELGHKNVEYEEYQGLDHGFIDGKGQSKKREVIADIQEWLRQDP